MNVAIVGYSYKVKSIIDVIDAKEVDNVFIKYVYLTSKEEVDKYDYFKQIVVKDYNKIIDDINVDTVMVFANDCKAYEYIKYALTAGKNVITSDPNIYKYYLELLRIASENNVYLLIDSAVNINFPVTNLLDTNLLGKISRIYSLLDYKSGLIIQHMINGKLSLEEATLQVLGPDSNVKEERINELAILATIAFNSKIDESKIHYRGLEGLDLEYLNVINVLGYRLRLESTALFHDGDIELVIEPVLHKNDEQLYYLDYSGAQALRVYAADAGCNTYCTKNSMLSFKSVIKANINTIKLGFNHKINIKNNYTCYGNERLFSQYILKASYLEPSLVDKKIGDIYITKPISGAKLNNLGEKITFYARIDKHFAK